MGYTFRWATVTGRGDQKKPKLHPPYIHIYIYKYCMYIYIHIWTNLYKSGAPPKPWNDLVLVGNPLNLEAPDLNNTHAHTPYTLPETNSSPLKMDGWNTTFLSGRPIFRAMLVAGRVHIFIIYIHRCLYIHIIQQYYHHFGPNKPPTIRHPSAISGI